MYLFRGWSTACHKRMTNAGARHKRHVDSYLFQTVNHAVNGCSHSGTLARSCGLQSTGTAQNGTDAFSCRMEKVNR